MVRATADARRAAREAAARPPGADDHRAGAMGSRAPLPRAGFAVGRSA